METTDRPSAWSDLQRRSAELALAQPALRRSPDDVERSVEEAVAAIAQHAEPLEEHSQTRLAEATMSLLETASAGPSLGVCRVERPFASLYVVLEPDGAGGYRQRVCCTHTTQHCAP